MTNTIKAIETRYKGYRFRSRLEARWAVFFDALGIKWQYEPEGFESQGVKYLPDFYLPDTHTWVEVKGSDEMLKDDASKLETLLDFQSPLHGVCDSAIRGFNPCMKLGGPVIVHGLLILGQIPDEDFVRGRIPLHPLIQHNKGLVFNRVFFSQSVFHPLTKLDTGSIEYGAWIGFDKEWSTVALPAPTFIPRPPHICANNAYEKARQARFEHGETP